MGAAASSFGFDKVKGLFVEDLGIDESKVTMEAKLEEDLEIGKREGDQLLKKRTEQFLKEKAETFLGDGRRATLKVTAEVSKSHDFEHDKNWPYGEGSEDFADQWKWRAAVVQIQRA